MAQSHLELNCLVRGDDTSRLFTVKIPSNDNVSALKEAILIAKTNEFNHVDANQLIIWKVSFRDDESLHRTLETLDLAEGDALRRSSARLSTVFPAPADGHLHVLIQRPATISPRSAPGPLPHDHDNLKLNCFVLGDDSNNVFPVNISEKWTVGQLKDLIKDKKKVTFQGVEADNLVLWKVSVSFEEFATKLANAQNPEHVTGSEKLKPVDLLTKQLLPLEEAHIHIIIERPATSRSRLRCTVSRLADEDIIQRHVKAAKEKKSPSAGATPSAFTGTQNNSPILNGRPFRTRATPVHLYHDVFTTFTNIYNDKTREIPPDIQKHIYELCQASSELYKTTGGGMTKRVTGENQRLKAIRPLYRKILDNPLPCTPADDNVADGTITTIMGDGQMALRGILEDKNEIGAASCDPNLQGCLSYIKYWSLDELKSIRNKCCCPSFVIAVPGPWIAVHGAVLCEAGWVVQPLTDLVNLQFDPYDSGRMFNIARLFLALRESLEELDTFYKDIENRTTSILWPSIRTCHGAKFQYLECLLPKYPSKAVFKGRMLPNHELIVIKFTNSYCVDAHRLLEKEGLAPRLRYFSGDDKAFKKPGGLEMVVMDFVEEDSGSSLTSEGREDVRHAISLLHMRDCVFGDLRHENILKLPNGHAMLVDFDWSGKEGQVFYPMGLNTQIKWPPGSGAGMLIQKAHDLFMFQQLSSGNREGADISRQS